MPRYEKTTVALHFTLNTTLSTLNTSCVVMPCYEKTTVALQLTFNTTLSTLAHHANTTVALHLTLNTTNRHSLTRHA